MIAHWAKIISDIIDESLTAESVPNLPLAPVKIKVIAVLTQLSMAEMIRSRRYYRKVGG